MSPITCTPDDGLFEDGPEFDQYLKALEDLARNVAAFDEILLTTAGPELLRVTLREFRTQARAAIQEGDKP